MRKTIFRGLNKKGEWVYGDLVNCVGIKHMPNQNTKTWIVTSAFGNGGWFNIRGREYVLPESVCQYTGYAHEGAPVFEGDIYNIDGYGLGVVVIDPYFGIQFKRENGGYVTLSNALQLDLDISYIGINLDFENWR